MHARRAGGEIPRGVQGKLSEVEVVEVNGVGELFGTRQQRVHRAISPVPAAVAHAHVGRRAHPGRAPARHPQQHTTHELNCVWGPGSQPESTRFVRIRKAPHKPRCEANNKQLRASCRSLLHLERKLVIKRVRRSARVNVLLASYVFESVIQIPSKGDFPRRRVWSLTWQVRE